ncbi:hypothetical protein GCM10010377_79890 [Streptomyces viridiviolaceus]|nr:hypothetical protein GCM10010377_79890 [Streptomyces viridiviolaceus]
MWIIQASYRSAGLPLRAVWPSSGEREGHVGAGASGWVAGQDRAAAVVRRCAVEHGAVRGGVRQALGVQCRFGGTALDDVGRADDQVAPLVQGLTADLAQAPQEGCEGPFGVQAAEGGMAAVDQGHPWHHQPACQRPARTALGYRVHLSSPTDRRAG